MTAVPHPRPPPKKTRRFPTAFFAACLLRATVARAAPPQYDHVVIVIEENHAQADIIGNLADAPFLNALAAGGLHFTSAYALTHPSQPNYLEFFSGSNQGVTGNGLPAALPFSTPNLGAEILAAGFTFTAYSEDLPTPGDATTTAAGYYARKHNPWTNWQDATLPLPPNRLPPSVNLQFSAFPSDFTTLPSLAIVVPSNAHNMHDGSIAEGDAWLAANFGAYAAWAPAHNSLLIVVWDEDSFGSGNRIPLIFHGAGVRPGVNSATWTLHHLLRTIEDIFGTAHAGSAAKVRPIADAFTGDLPTATVTFQQGADGYSGTRDTSVRADDPDADFGTFSPLTTGPGAQTLVRFENLTGHQPGQIPPGAQILSAKLLLTTAGPSAQTFEAHRMLAPWDESATWNSLGDGVSSDDLEAAATPDFSVRPNLFAAPAIFDVTGTVRAWVNGATNYGWALTTTTAGTWSAASAEDPIAVRRPVLEVTFAPSFLEFSAASYGVGENAGAATITVTRRGAASTAVTVGYATVASPALGDAAAGSDYTAVSGTLSWPAGDFTSRTFTVPILADAVPEGIETLLLTLANPTGTAFLTAASSATLAITETPFDAWRVAHFGPAATTPDAAADADPDHDRACNLLEYATGTDPLDAASAAPPQLVAGSFLTLAFTRIPTATDLHYTVQVSPDLQTWADGSTYASTGSAPPSAFTTEVSRNGANPETVTVRDNTAISAAPHRYLRLRITRP